MLTTVDIAKGHPGLPDEPARADHPRQVGLALGSDDASPGCAGEEAAQLAGVSTEDYTQIERRNVGGVSDEVLQAITRALRLSDDETAHFFDLCRAAAGGRHRPDDARPHKQVPSGVQALMDSMTAAPAIVITGSLDIVAGNTLGRGCTGRCSSVPQESPTWLVSCFDSAAARSFRTGTPWPTTPSACCRPRPPAHPTHSHSPMWSESWPPVTNRSRTRWAAHNVKAHRNGTKRFHLDQFGELTLNYNVFDITATPGLSLVGYTAEPQSPSAQTLRDHGQLVCRRRTQLSRFRPHSRVSVASWLT